MKHSIPFITAAAARILLLLLVASGAAAGPLEVPDLEQIAKPPVPLECDYCAYVTNYESMPEVPPGDPYLIVGVLTALAAIGLTGVRFRVREKRYATGMLASDQKRTLKRRSAKES